MDLGRVSTPPELAGGRLCRLGCENTIWPRTGRIMSSDEMAGEKTKSKISILRRLRCRIESERAQLVFKVLTVVGSLISGTLLLLTPYCLIGTNCAAPLWVVQGGIVGTVLIVGGLFGSIGRWRLIASHPDWPSENRPRFRVLDPKDWPSVRDALMAIENSSFSETIADSAEDFEKMLKLNNSIFVIAECDRDIIGYAGGGRLEDFQEIPGVKEDLHFGLKDTFYIESFAVSEKFRGKGVGRGLMRALLLRVKKSGFRWTSAHGRADVVQRWGGMTTESFNDWYHTGKTFDYFRRDLSFGDWIESSKSMVLAESILAGFSAVVLSIISTQLSTNILVQVALAFEVGAVTLLILAAEETTDALDKRDLTTYARALVYYNFGVVLLLSGLASYLFQLSFGTQAVPTTLGPVAFRVIALLLTTVLGWFWLWDSVWLLFRKNRLEWVYALEFGENV